MLSLTLTVITLVITPCLILGDNTTSSRQTDPPKRRSIFGMDFVYFSFDSDIYISIPLSEIGTRVITSFPLTYSWEIALPELPSGRSSKSEKKMKERQSMYTTIERMVSTLLNIDGHACLLRAICEASSPPAHGDGFLG